MVDVETWVDVGVTDAVVIGLDVIVTVGPDVNWSTSEARLV